MLLPVRERVGLGSPPNHECINNALKVKMDYKHSELAKFVEKLHERVDDQQHEVEKALVGCGKYYIHPDYLKKSDYKEQATKEIQ